MTTVAIVHDYLTQRGGAERVVLSMLRAFPDAPLYTSLYSPEGTFPEFRGADVRTLPLNRSTLLRRHHRLAAPFLATAFSMLKVDADVVLCSSSGWAHGVQATGRKVVYCYTPARWLYEADRYFGCGRHLTQVPLNVLRPLLARWDRRAARSARQYLTHSSAVRDQIRLRYGLNAELVPAPFVLGPGEAQPVGGIDPGFFLCVSRLLPYKNVDAIVTAFSRLPERRLVVVGTGPEEKRLRKMATENVRLLGTIPDGQLRWLYAHTAGLIAASFEDYGLTPLEAAACGKPTAALRWGGFLDTVIEGENGLFFDAPTPSSIHDAVLKLAEYQFNAQVIRERASRYSEQVFISRLQAIVAREVLREAAATAVMSQPAMAQLQ